MFSRWRSTVRGLRNNSSAIFVVVPPSPIIWNICSSRFVKSKVYALTYEDIVILDAATGDILHKVPHGLLDPDAHHQSSSYVYPYFEGDTEYLLITCERYGLLQVRSHDGKDILKNIHLPLPYTTSHHPPQYFDNKVYLSLTHADRYDNSMKGAVLVVSGIAENLDGRTVEAECEPRPPTTVTRIIRDGEPVYCVTIEHDNVDDLLRFSTIALKEVAFKHADYLTSTERDKEHSGKLLLQVKAAPLAMDDNELLDALGSVKERVEQSLSSMDVDAGDGSSEYTVDVELI